MVCLEQPSRRRLPLDQRVAQAGIPETTVDLFEACIQVQLEALGLRVHFVDCWYYHIRLGEIHCGTNVLRAAPKTKVKWWKLKELAAA
jgi:hypothetical protein